MLNDIFLVHLYISISKGCIIQVNCCFSSDFNEGNSPRLSIASSVLMPIAWLQLLGEVLDLDITVSLVDGLIY